MPTMNVTLYAWSKKQRDTICACKDCTKTHDSDDVEVHLPLRLSPEVPHYLRHIDRLSPEDEQDRIARHMTIEEKSTALIVGQTIFAEVNGDVQKEAS